MVFSSVTDHQNGPREFISPLAEIKSGAWVHLPRSENLGAKLRRFARSRTLDDARAVVEGPWSPAPEALPQKRTPEDAGNSTAPFRQFTRDNDPRLRFIRQHSGACDLSDWTTIRTHHVPIADLPKQLEYFKILHLSDIHFVRDNQLMTLEMRRVAKAAVSGEISFDMVVITGDTITHAPDDIMDEQLRILRDIAGCAKYAFAVLGNHDYHHHSPSLIQKALAWAGYTDLTNKNAFISVGDRRLTICGLDDAYFGLPRAPDKLDQKDVNLLLAHNTDALRSNIPRAVDLILAGHTHWGESPWLPGTQLMKWWGYCNDANRHKAGWSTYDDRALGYICRGLAAYYVTNRGFWHKPGFAHHTLVPWTAPVGTSAKTFPSPEQPQELSFS